MNIKDLKLNTTVSDNDTYNKKESMYNVSDDLAERRNAFARMENLRRHMIDLDDKSELAEYRDKKYGN